MFSLIAGLWKYFFTRPNLHILIIGLDHAGKSTLLEKIKTQFGTIPGLPPEKIPPTVGMNLAKIVYRGSQVIFWDLGGQLKIRSIWERYYEEADAVIYVVDSADLSKLDEAKREYDSTCEHDALAMVPIFTFANKQDLPDAMSPGDLALSFYHIEKPASLTDLDLRPVAVPTDKGMDASHTSRIPAEDTPRVLGISAITGLGLEEALHTVVLEAKRLSRKNYNI